MKTILLLVSMLFVHLTASANPFASPEAFIKEFDCILGRGVADYALSWYSAAPLSKEINTEKAIHAIAVLRKFDMDYGNVLEIKVLEKRTIAESSTIVYLAVVHERGSVFYFVKLSEDGQGWLLTEFRFNSNPDQILPVRLLNKK